MHVANVSLVDINFIVLDWNEFFVLPNIEYYFTEMTTCYIDHYLTEMTTCYIDHYLTEMTTLGLLPVTIFFQRSTTAETGSLGLKNYLLQPEEPLRLVAC